LSLRGSGALRAAGLGALQRVGQRQRQQAADVVAKAGVDQPVDPGRAQQAARGVVHQHPVVITRAAPLQLGQPVGDGLGTRGATAVRGPVVLGNWRPGPKRELRITRRQHHQRGLQSRHLPQRHQRVRHQRAPGDLRVLLRCAQPGALPTPAQGTNAYSAPRSPLRRHRVAVDRRIGRQQRQAMADRLAHQQPVKGVGVHGRQLVEHQRRGLVQRQRVDAVAFALARHVGRGRPASASRCPAPPARPMRPAAGRAWHRPPAASAGDALLLAVVTAEPGRRPAPGRRTALLRARAARRAVPRLGDAALRHLLPHQDLISERLATLWRVQGGDRGRGAAAGHHRADAPGAALVPGRLHLPLQAEERLDEAALKSQLTLAGYQHVSQVVSPGEYAVRGGLIDLYPMGSPVPYRVDLFGDEVDSIRTFDPDTQRSLYPVPEVRLLPGREFPMDEAARTAFRARWRERIEGDPTVRIYKDMARASPRPASSTTCRCSSTRRRRSSTTWASRPRWCCTARSTRRWSASGPTRASATASCSTTPSGRSCRRRTSS
jgi:hypothetical protein